MGKNTGDGRKGAVCKRSQTHNPVTGQYVKRDTDTGKFIGAKKGKYKGVREER